MQLAQALDAEAPVDAKYIPGAHASHEVDATAPEYWPVGQFMHAHWLPLG